MQEVNFATLQGVKPFEQLTRLGMIDSFLKSEKVGKRELRRFFRQHDMFDADTYDTLLDFLEVDTSNGKHIKSGPFLTKLSGLVMPDERKAYLFEFLTKKNEILMKYIMDGLAEHLHSTNELYRYITSYVYPGSYITLVNFRNWLSWLEASEHIRVIGIRWGLSDLGREAMDNIIKLIDIDEILEDEYDDDYDDEDEDDDEEEDSDDDDAQDSDDSQDDDEEEDSDDEEIGEEVVVPAPEAASTMTEEAPLPSIRQPSEPVVKTTPIKSATKSVVREEVVVQQGPSIEYVVQPIAPVPHETPLNLVREAFAEADAEEEENDDFEMDSAPKVRIEQFRLEEDLVAENVRALHFWWRQRPGGKVLTAQDYDLQKEEFENDPAYALFKLTALALQLFRYQGRLQVAKGGQSYAILDQMGFYNNLFKSRKNVDTILDALLKGGLGQHVEYFSNLHLILVARRNLKELKDEGVRAIWELPTIAEVVTSLWESLSSFALSYEILWITRELATMGLLKAADAMSLGVVPLPKVRETAFRLGFIETPYAADFPHLVSISRRLTKFFGVEDAWEAPLVYFEPKRDLRYDSSEPAYFTRDQLGID